MRWIKKGLYLSLLIVLLSSCNNEDFLGICDKDDFISWYNSKLPAYIELCDCNAPSMCELYKSDTDEQILSKVNVGTNDNVSGDVSYKYNAKFNLTNGFTVTYMANCKQYTGNYSDSYVMGVKVGNITFALKEYATPTILIDNAVVASGDVMGKTEGNFDDETGRIKWTQYAAYLHSTGKDFVYKATYDAETKTLTYGAYADGVEVAKIASFVDTDGKVSVDAAEFALYTNDRWDQYVTYTNVKLTGGKPTDDTPSGDTGSGDSGSGDAGSGDTNSGNTDKPALEGLAVKFDKDNVIVENDWTGKGGTKVSGDKTSVQLASGDGEGASTFTYNKYYNLTKGFTVSYSVDCKRYTGNYSKNYVMGAKIGNVTVALKDYATPVILIDGNEVATGDIIGKNSTNYDSDANKIKWSEYKEYLQASTGLSTVLKQFIMQKPRQLPLALMLTEDLLLQLLLILIQTARCH